MRILIDIRLLSPGGNSGIETYTTELLNALFSIDRTNEYGLFSSGFRRAPLPPAWGQIANVKILTSNTPNRIIDLMMRANIVPRAIRDFNPELIFSPHFTTIAARGTPHIITFHDLSFIHHPEFFSLKQKFWHAIQDYRAAALRATHLITDSEYTRHDLIKTLGADPARVSAIPLGIKPSLHHIPMTDGRLVAFARENNILSPFLLTLSTLEPRKNIPLIIRAFTLVKHEEENRDLKLVIAGKPGWLYRSIREEYERSPYKSHITFWGAVEPHDTLYLYNLAQAFLYPSFFEGFGLPPLEAQACGTPAIAADRTSIPEVLGDSALLINPWSVEDLASAIESVISNPEVRSSLIEKGLQNASQFSWKKTAEATLEVFERINIK